MPGPAKVAATPKPPPVKVANPVARHSQGPARLPPPLPGGRPAIPTPPPPMAAARLPDRGGGKPPAAATPAPAAKPSQGHGPPLPARSPPRRPPRRWLRPRRAGGSHRQNLVLPLHRRALSAKTPALPAKVPCHHDRVRHRCRCRLPLRCRARQRRCRRRPRAATAGQAPTSRHCRPPLPKVWPGSPGARPQPRSPATRRRRTAPAAPTSRHKLEPCAGLDRWRAAEPVRAARAAFRRGPPRSPDETGRYQSSTAPVRISDRGRNQTTARDRPGSAANRWR